jgi:mannitol/fructose-specific phosphotransferase system IIA component (Ntr-type)
MDFASRDGVPAQIIVLLGSPLDKTGPHIQALASITRLMLVDQFRAAVIAADSADALYKVIADHEA